MADRKTIVEQFRRNAVALISLAIAITSLGYNTWRNEASEHNRNQRLVSIELMLMLGELRQTTLDCHYGDPEDCDRLLRAGWSTVLTIRDLSTISEGMVPDSASQLYDAWQADYKVLADDLDAKDRIIDAIELVRMYTHEVLQNLD